jgi:mannose-6-phosphate isomerase-like protein (cupin superfamily)
MMKVPQTNLEIYAFTDLGYMPLVFSGGWQVALLNWEPLFDLDNAGEIERHNQTDEVFVLWRGQALIFASDDERLHAQEMQPGVIYNVPAGTWHNLLASRDASWIIVENRDTHLGDTELRQMTAAEWAQLRATLPEWVKELR